MYYYKRSIYYALIYIFNKLIFILNIKIGQRNHASTCKVIKLQVIFYNPITKYTYTRDI